MEAQLKELFKPWKNGGAGLEDTGPQSQMAIEEIEFPSEPFSEIALVHHHILQPHSRMSRSRDRNFPGAGTTIRCDDQ
jgi:hypothetical protein